MSKSIGLWRSWALVAGMMIGSGIFTLPALLAPYGSYSFIGWGVTGFGAMCLALSYSYLSSRKPGLGGPYFYVFEAFGAIPAAIVCLGYWISLVTSIAAISLSFAGYSQTYLTVLDDEPLYRSLFAIAIILIFTFINVRGVREASAVQLFTTVVKIVPLLLIGFVGIIYGEVTHIEAINPDDNSLFHMVGALCLLIMWGFIGVESATLPSEDTINPKKTIARASILGTLTALTVYVIAMFGVMSIMSLAELQNSTSPFTDAAQLIMGDTGAIIITIGALFAIGGTLNVCIMIAGTIMLAGARDNIFPAYFSRQNTEGTPTTALLFSSAFAIILLLFNTSESLINSFENLLILATFAALVVYLGTGLASIKLQLRDHKQGEQLSYKRLCIALLATLFSLLAIIGAWILYQ
jgi:APA family basic amino acid/polyamine antiporter